jgi:hypothetical protein
MHLFGSHGRKQVVVANFFPKIGKVGKFLVKLYGMSNPLFRDYVDDLLLPQ